MAVSSASVIWIVVVASLDGSFGWRDGPGWS